MEIEGTRGRVWTADGKNVDGKALCKQLFIYNGSLPGKAAPPPPNASSPGCTCQRSAGILGVLCLKVTPLSF